MQLALVIALLSLLPNLVMAGLVLLPTVRDVGGLEPRVTAGLVGWAALVVAFSAGIGAVLARVLLAPLTRVTRDADALPRTARHLGRARLAAPSDDPPEVRSLRLAIDRLLAQVQTEQARRSAFTATLMHDMKTPLLAQGTALKLLRDDLGDLSDEERTRLLDQAVAETEAVGSLVQQLVDAHRFEQGTVRPKRVASDLRALVDGEVARRRGPADERGVLLEIDGDATARVDPDLIARAVDNLVGNAVRYARSLVRIEIRPGLLRIADDG
ncbi:MAG: histidine kinase dimerization/phospho-acceptor domain-containing protein, partial [Trueperaceae bacterium]